MARPKRSIKNIPVIESSDSEDESPTKKSKLSPGVQKDKSVKKTPTENGNDSSSSDSDIENYLQPVDKLDFSSSFFNLQKNNEGFSKIENSILEGVSRLSDSDSEKEEEKHESPNGNAGFKKDVAPKANFEQLEVFTRKIEEAKLHVEKYNAKKKIREKNQDISNLLLVGETKQLTLENIREEDLHSSDFETTDEEEWEEVKGKETEEKQIIPKQNIEIRIGEMPEHCRKKKGIDLLAAMKRRLNRIRKENQKYVHKVHLLSWIAHGNYVNSVVNNSDILALALSLLPSDKCYPSDRADLGYLEQIVQWYKKAIKLTEKTPPQELALINSLKLQIKNKTAFSKNMYVLIFIAILRALGIQCRLVLSFQVEPLRPPSRELHSLSTKEVDKKKTAPSTSKSGVAPSNKSKAPTSNKSKAVDKSNANNSKIASKGIVVDEKTKLGKQVRKENDKLDDKNSSRHFIINKDNESKLPNKQKSTGSRPDLHKLKKRESSNKASEKAVEEQPIKKVEKQSKDRKILYKETNIKNESNDKVTETKIRPTITPEKLTSRTRSAKMAKEKSKDSTEVGAELSKKVTGTKKEQRTNTSNRKRTSNEENEKPSKEVKSINKDTLLVAENKPRSKSASCLDDKNKSTPAINKDNLKVESQKPRSKSTSSNNKSTDIKSRSKSIIKIKLPKIIKKSEENNIPQVDGANDDQKSKRSQKNDKPNLQKLKTKPAEKVCSGKTHARRLKSSFYDDDSESEFSTSPVKSSPSKGLNFSKLKQPSTSSFVPSQLDVKNDIISLIKGRIAEQKSVDRRTVVKRKVLQNVDSDSDSDYMPEPFKKKYHNSDSEVEYFSPKPKVKKRIRVKKEDGKLKVLSSDDEAEKKKKKGVNIWVEVFLESEETWISTDVIRGQVHCVNELYMRASHPVTYVVAWNNDDSLKDVTKRYCKSFNTVTRKLRIDSKWWEQSLKPFLEKSTLRSINEDADLARQQSDQPLPKSIAEYKNHPLYALARHLLKFEAIYPPNIVPLGYVRGEPVYPRISVYTCRSREIWLKEAKVVKPDEKPYKIVKARPKYDKLSNQVITDQLLEIFGEWQTMDYDPPTAENGIVPRNAFGNVELFKPCMLPKETVHIKLPGLNKVCRKLNIDCASAIVGFDFHGGWSHPVYDGFVVCKEFEDTVIAAWYTEQEELEKKENEKIEKRVYTNWKKLIKGLLIRERLKARYDFGSETSAGGKGKKTSKGPRFVTKKR